MTDLQGADLSLAVARVMGKEAVRTWAPDYSTCRLRESLMDHNGDTYTTITSEWRPDLGGAAGAEVLEWARENIPGFQWNDSHPCNEFCWKSPSRFGGWSYEDGPAIWIALCRAVVAWGERR